MAVAGKKSLLIISEAGKPVRTVRINFFTVFFLFLFIAAGCAAYFLPPDLFKLKSAELFQEKDLSKENGVLHQRIGASLQMLNSVKEQMAGLETKKEKVSALMGSARADSAQKATLSAPMSDAHISGDLAGLLDRVTRLEAAMESFAGRSGNPFDSIPVCRPVPASAAAAVGFGRATDPFTKKNKWHYGVDFAAPEGTPVFAAAAGQVERSENDPVWGKRVVIDHKNGYVTIYAHLGRALVAKGRKVGRGEMIGEIGYSGLTTGPHVHYEIRRDTLAVDPEKYFFPLSASSQFGTN